VPPPSGGSDSGSTDAGSASTIATPPKTPDGSTGGSSGSDRVNGCTLPQVVGRCKAALPRYWYNAESGECERFIYGE